MSSQLQSINPHNNQVIATFDEHTDDQIDGILDEALAQHMRWASEPMNARQSSLVALAKGLRAKSEPYAALMTEEMGKPIAQARAEIEKCAWAAEYYAEHAAAFLADQQIASAAKQSTVVFRPLGVVLAIMPWNFPFWQAFRFAVPAIAAGNTVVLKHASNVTGCAHAIEEVFEQNVGKNTLRALVMGSSRVANVIADDRVSAVTFTGSTDAGRKVGMAAGEALKKTVLELGGSDPYVILADADIEEAARVCATARMVNAGQSCIAAKRFIADKAVYSQFVDALCKRMASYKSGDPMDAETDVGPMARTDLANELHDQVEKTVAAGARCALGGKREIRGGAHYPVTVLTEVAPGMPAFDEELFGPVAAVARADGVDDAMRLANQSRFGLGGAIFTANESGGYQLARDVLHAGTIAINGQVQSDPRLPFGGIKDSGYGRELGEFGIREFVNVKTVSQF